MTSLVGPLLACSSVATGDVILESRAKRHRSAAPVASARLAPENVVVHLDDCSASGYTFFGTPETAESGGSPVRSVCDEDASSDEFEGLSSAIAQDGIRESGKLPGLSELSTDAIRAPIPEPVHSFVPMLHWSRYCVISAQIEAARDLTEIARLFSVVDMRGRFLYDVQLCFSHIAKNVCFVSAR